MLNHLPLTINTRSQRYGFGKYEGSFTYDEKNKIFDREFRSENVENINGRGIGLYLLKQICNSNSIEVEHKIGSDWFFDENQVRYSTFSIKLIFNNITRQEEI